MLHIDAPQCQTNPFKPDFTLSSNSRLAVDGDDLMWFENKENYHVLVILFMEIFVLKTLLVGKLSLFTGQ